MSKNNILLYKYIKTVYYEEENENVKRLEYIYLLLRKCILYTIFVSAFTALSTTLLYSDNGT